MTARNRKQKNASETQQTPRDLGLNCLRIKVKSMESEPLHIPLYIYVYNMCIVGYVTVRTPVCKVTVYSYAFQTVQTFSQDD